MKSKVLIDTDYDEKSILKISYFETDDIRDKAVRNFMNKIHGGGNCKLQIIKEYAKNSSPNMPNSILTLKVLSEEEYVDKRWYLSNSETEGYSLVGPDWFGSLIEDDKDSYKPPHMSWADWHDKKCKDQESRDLRNDSLGSEQYLLYCKVITIVDTYRKLKSKFPNELIIIGGGDKLTFAINDTEEGWLFRRSFNRDKLLNISEEDNFIDNIVETLMSIERFYIKYLERRENKNEKVLYKNDDEINNRKEVKKIL